MPNAPIEFAVIILLLVLLAILVFIVVQRRLREQDEIVEEVVGKIEEDVKASPVIPAPQQPKRSILSLWGPIHPEHPFGKHNMRFKKRGYNRDLLAVVYYYKCLYCDLEVRIKTKAFWGKPTENRTWKTPPAHNMPEDLWARKQRGEDISAYVPNGYTD